MGSVKDLTILEKPLKNKTGIGIFSFSERYSLFDWGEMPDHIHNKGASLCILSAYFFEKLEEMGIKTHYLGVIEDNKVKKLSELKNSPTSIKVKLLRVIKPEIRGTSYDYSVYHNEKSNFLIPLEIIYRNSLPEGSSIFRRLKEGSLKLSALGLKKMPLPGMVLEKPFLDVSTKLETSDRYISWEEAKNIANLTNDRISEIKRTLFLINEIITKEVSKAGLKNEDGKVEFGIDEKQNLIVVDALGTLDECRFTLDGSQISKEIARTFYRTTPWYENVESAKKKNRIEWKKLVEILPPLLPVRLKNLISLLYQASANEITGRKWFKDIPLLKEIIEEIKKFTSQQPSQ